MPTSDEMKHFGAAMPVMDQPHYFTLLALPQRPMIWLLLVAPSLPAVKITDKDLSALRSDFGGKGDRPDVVVFAAPQLSIVEMEQVTKLVDGQTLKYQ